MNQVTVAVIYGGRSAERQVSLESGSMVAAALRERSYQVIDVDLYGDQGTENPIQQLSNIQFDVAFIALHGGEGEDGTIQALLTLMGKPFTGSKPLASGFAMDKALTKQFWQGIGIPTPAYLCFEGLVDEALINKTMQYPLIVKPSREGSTIGISKVDGPEQLPAALVMAQRYDSDVLVEEYITGKEYTVTVIADEAYAPIRLQPSAEHVLYDYDAKYLANDTQYLIPCGLSTEKEQELKELALAAYRSVGCEGWGRVDVMQSEDGKFWVLEVNTSPGMTSHSLVPMAAKHAGLSYQDLVERLVQDALARSV